jgi:hypothetical protein
MVVLLLVRIGTSGLIIAEDPHLAFLFPLSPKNLGLLEGGSAGTHLLAANFSQIREEAVNAGFITNKEVDQMLALLDDPDFVISAHVMFTAWGQRPSPTTA